MTDDFNDSLDNLFAGDVAPQGARKVTPINQAAADYIAKTTAPEYVQRCHKCHGTGHTRWGACYACRGAGGKTFKTSPEARAKASVQRAERKASQDAQALDAWKAANPEAWAWLDRIAPRWELAASLLNGLKQYGSLTEKQMAIVTNGIARDAARAQERAQAVQSAPEVASEGIDRLQASFDKAVAYAAEKGLMMKTPMITIGRMVIYPAKADGKNPGALYVKTGKRGGDYLGKVQNGRFFASRECSTEQGEQVMKFIADPKAAAEAYGQTTGVCCLCSATLRSEWKERGIGPICAMKFGW